MSHPARSILFLTLTLCAILGLVIALAGCSIGPTTEVRYLLVHPGQPIKVLESATLQGEQLDGGGLGKFDVGGWVAMPPDHWEAVRRILTQYTKEHAPAPTPTPAPPAVPQAPAGPPVAAPPR